MTSEPQYGDQPRSHLTAGIDDLSGPIPAAIHALLGGLLGTPDRPVPFGGREAELALLDQWLADPSVPRALVVANAGAGKSTLVARWAATVADERRADVALLPINLRWGTCAKDVAIDILAARLCHLRGTTLADATRDGTLTTDLVQAYLAADAAPDDRPLVVIIDGADEAAAWDLGVSLRLPERLGNGVKVLVTARPVADRGLAGWREHLGPGWDAALAIPLGRLARDGIAQTLASLGGRLADLAPGAELPKALEQVTGGDPLLVGLYVEAIRSTNGAAGVATADDLSEVVPDIDACFDRWWADQLRQWAATGTDWQRPVVQATLRVLATALGPMSRDDMLAVAGADLGDAGALDQALHVLGRFVSADPGQTVIAFQHPRLARYFFRSAWLLGDAERREIDRRFVAYGERALAQLAASQEDESARSRRALPSPYVVRHHREHLQRAGAPTESLYRLVSEDWLQAWLAVTGTQWGFLADVDAAMEAALDTPCDLAMLVQCVMWRARVVSMSERFPDKLLVEAVSVGLLTETEAIHIGARKPHPRMIANSMVTLAPVLEPEALAHAVAVVDALDDYVERAFALCDLAHYLPEEARRTLVGRALADAVSANVESDKALLLSTLAAHLSEAQALTALAAARDLTEAEPRTGALAALGALVPELPATARAQALADAVAAANDMDDDWQRVRALSAIAPHLPESDRRAAFKAALAAGRQIGDMWWRADALTSVASRLPGIEGQAVVAEAVAAAGRIRLEKPVFIWYPLPRVGSSVTPAARQLLADLFTDRFPGGPLDATGRGSRGATRASALSRLAPLLSADLLPTALQATREITPPAERAEALTALAIRLPSGQRAPVLSEAVASASEIDAKENWYEQALAYVELAPHLPATEGSAMLGEVLAGAADYAAVWLFAPAMAVLVSHLHGDNAAPLRATALATARKATPDQHRIDALTTLAPCLPESERRAVVAEALSAAQLPSDVDSMDLYCRGLALICLAERLPPEEQAPARLGTLAYITKSAADRFHAAWWLAPFIPEDWHAEVLALTEPGGPLFDIEDEYVTRLTSHRRAVQRAEAVADEPTAGSAIHIDEPIQRLCALAARAPEAEQRSLMSGALAILRTPDEDWSLDSLYAMAPFLPADLVPDAMNLVSPSAQGLSDDEYDLQACWEIYSEFLCELAAHMPPERRQPVIAEALVAARTIDSPAARAHVLCGIALQVPDDHRHILQEALDSVDEIGNEDHRFQVLEGLLHHWPDADLPLVLAAAMSTVQGIDGTEDQTTALEDLSPILARCETILPGSTLDLWRHHARFLTGIGQSDVAWHIAALSEYLAVLTAPCPGALRRVCEVIVDADRWLIGEQTMAATGDE